MTPFVKAYAHTHIEQEWHHKPDIHIAVSESSIRICLFDDPRLIVEDARLEVRPPLAFQVLVALALSKPRIVSRSEMARLLFPGVDPKERRSQLRIVLAHLRRRLCEETSFRGYADDGTNLHLDESVALDAYELLSAEPISLERLAAYSRPVLVGCQSRFAEKCRGVVKNAVEASLPSAIGHALSTADLWSVTPILGELRTLYPLSTTICAYQVAVLKRLHLFEEATRELTEFETQWLETYGSQDKPDLDAIIGRIELC